MSAFGSTPEVNPAKADIGDGMSVVGCIAEVAGADMRGITFSPTRREAPLRGSVSIVHQLATYLTTPVEDLFLLTSTTNNSIFNIKHMGKPKVTGRIFVIHENDTWVQPLRTALSEFGLPYDECPRVLMGNLIDVGWPSL